MEFDYFYGPEDADQYQYAGTDDRRQTGFFRESIETCRN